MTLKNCVRVIAFMLFFAIAVPGMIAKNGANADGRVNKKYLVGDWFAQIDIPQGETRILMEINILDSKNCVIKCRWISPGATEKKSGKAKYRLKGNQLTITFLNEDELIRTDHIFNMKNIYDISLTRDNLVIHNNKQFRNVDITFGRGYNNRGFAEILFPED